MTGVSIEELAEHGRHAPGAMVQRGVRAAPAASARPLPRDSSLARLPRRGVLGMVVAGAMRPFAFLI